MSIPTDKLAEATKIINELNPDIRGTVRELDADTKKRLKELKSELTAEAKAALGEDLKAEGANVMPDEARTSYLWVLDKIERVTGGDASSLSESVTPPAAGLTPAVVADAASGTPVADAAAAASTPAAS